MTLIYLILFGTANFILYSFLNKLGIVSLKLSRIFLGAFIIFILLHLEAFKIQNLMPFDYLLLVCQFFISNWLFHSIGKWYINRTKASTILPEKGVQLIVRLTSIIFLKGMFIFTFILQSVFIIRYG
jgi:hypothetical protein